MKISADRLAVLSGLAKEETINESKTLQSVIAEENEELQKLRDIIR